MEISTQIKQQRMRLQLSQESLAEKVFVTRQTISNWETGKSYPDIQSLLLLSSLFDISLDQLIKGDADIMKEEIRATEQKKLRKNSLLLSIFMAVTVVSAVPLTVWLGIYALIPWGGIFSITMFFACRAERIKKENHVQTYREIVAFMEGKRLNAQEQWKEKGKLPYQRIFMTVISGALALIICLIWTWIFA